VQALIDYEKENGVTVDNQDMLMALKEYHAEVAETLIDVWGLPESMAEAIGCHHDWTAADQARVPAAILHLADHQAHVVQGTVLVMSEGIDKSVIEELNLYPEDMESLEAKHGDIEAYVEALKS
jgi:HD-like signal output (HDOD) protein